MIARHSRMSSRVSRPTPQPTSTTRLPSRSAIAAIAAGSPGRDRGAASVGERHRAFAGELQQRRGALDLGVLDEVGLVERALVEADRAHEEAAALLDEL